MKRAKGGLEERCCARFGRRELLSRVGAKPIPIPEGVTVVVEAGNVILVNGPKGELQQQINPDLKVLLEDRVVRIERPAESARHRSQHGLARTLINNMVSGVSNGFTKMLEVHGVGYRAILEGKDLVLNVGYSHPVRLTPPDGIKFEVGTGERSRLTQITVTGIDKQAVGQVAADIRKVRKPDAYKGKGIRYKDEYVKLKQSKRVATVGEDM